MAKRGQRRSGAKKLTPKAPAPGTLDWQLSEGPACDIRWLVHVCERNGETFRGLAVPKHLSPASVSLAHAITNAGLARSDILHAVSTLCRFRWRTLVLRNAHRSVSPYTYFPAKGPLFDDYSEMLGEPYVSQAKIAAFGLICLDRGVAHSARGNIEKSHSYTTNAARVANLFGAQNSARELRKKRAAARRLGADAAREKTEKKVAKWFRKLRAENRSLRVIPKTIALELKLTQQHVGRIIRKLNLT